MINVSKTFSLLLLLSFSLKGMEKESSLITTSNDTQENTLQTQPNPLNSSVWIESTINEKQAQLAKIQEQKNQLAKEEAQLEKEKQEHEKVRHLRKVAGILSAQVGLNLLLEDFESKIKALSLQKDECETEYLALARQREDLREKTSPLRVNPVEQLISASQNAQSHISSVCQQAIQIASEQEGSILATPVEQIASACANTQSQVNRECQSAIQLALEQEAYATTPPNPEIVSEASIILSPAEPAPTLTPVRKTWVQWLLRK